jgi:hypothetical protein
MTTNNEVKGSPVIFVQDSFGTMSACRNEPNLTYEESLIGKIVWLRSSGQDEWEVLLKDESSLGKHSSINRARQALEQHYNNSSNKTSRK